MKKILVALMSLMLLFGSVSYANGLAKQDAELLFGTQKVTKVQAVALDKSEMVKTEGKAIWFAPFAWTTVRVAITGFTRHGLNQIINRGATRAVTYTMKNATRAFSDIARRTTRYESRKGVVILNEFGKVVSAWRWSR